MVDLPEPVGPVHEHEAALLLADFLQNRRHAELIESHDLGRDRAEHDTFALSLHEHVDAEAGDVTELEGEVDVELLLKHPAVHVVHHVERHVVNLVPGERSVVESLDVAVDTQHRRLAAREV